MKSKPGRVSRLTTTFGLALVAVLAFGAIAAGAAQAAFLIEGKTLTQWGAQEETFASTGTYEFEWKPLGLRYTNCSETGKGTFFVGNKLELREVTLTGCKVKGQEKTCFVDPIHFEPVAGPAVGWLESPNPGEIFTAVVIKGAECAWTGEFFFSLDKESWLLKYGTGPEAQTLPVTSTFTTKFSETKLYWSGSSSWTLTGAHKGSVWKWRP